MPFHRYSTHICDRKKLKAVNKRMLARKYMLEKISSPAKHYRYLYLAKPKGSVYEKRKNYQ